MRRLQWSRDGLIRWLYITFPSSFYGSVVPDSVYAPGLNSVVVDGEGNVVDVVRQIALDSEHAIRIIWV